MIHFHPKLKSFINFPNNNLNLKFFKFYSKSSIILLVLLAFFLSSCGIFLQNHGIKNYKPQKKIAQNGLNNYQYDFLYLTNLVEEGFPLLDSVFAKDIREKQAEEIVGKLANVDNDIDFILQSKKYLSNLKNQHTRIGIEQNFKHIYPYVIYISSNNWYLLNISKSYDSVSIGKKISKINEIGTNEIEERLIGFTSAENKINQQYAIRAYQLYNKPQYLKNIGVIKNDFDNLKLKFEDESSIEIAQAATDNKENKLQFYAISLKENKITEFQKQTYFYKLYPNKNFGYLQFNSCHDKIDVIDGIESYVKPWLQGVARGYVKNQFKKKNPSKRIANFYNPQYPIFKDFVWELVDSLNAQKIDNLVIDLRNNPGGNLMLGVQLLYFLTESDSLKGFKEFAYTSRIYKQYFREEYEKLDKSFRGNAPENKLIPIHSGQTIFAEINDKNSVYYVSPQRPIFKGKVFVLSNFRTGSAAALLTTLFQDNEIGTVIGTSVGNNPTGATSYTPLDLPKTKATVSIATTYLERPSKEKGKIQVPNKWIEYSVSDLINGNDPYLQYVREVIENKKPPLR